MKYLLSVLFLTQFSLADFAQTSKPVLDTSAFYQWPALCDNPEITSDGNYIGYFFCNYGSPKTFVIQNAKTSWKQSFGDVNSFSFSKDSKNAVFILPNDTLCIVTLGTLPVEKIPNVSAYQLIDITGDQWLLFHKNSPDRDLFVRNTVTGREREYNQVTDYFVWQKCHCLLLQTDTVKAADKSFILRSVDLVQNLSHTIWEGDSVTNIVCDSNGRQIAFTVPHELHKYPTIRERQNDIWYFEQGMESAKILYTTGDLATHKGYKIDHVERFTADDSCIIVALKYEAPLPDHLYSTNVNVWSYRDAVIQSQQIEQFPDDQGIYYRAIISLRDGSVRYFQNEHETILMIVPVYSKYDKDDLIVFDQRKGDPYEELWSSAAQPSYVIVSLKTGIRHVINFNFTSISPDGRYILGRKYPEEDFVACDRATGRTINISGSIPIPTRLDDNSFQQTKDFYGMGDWINKDHPLLIIYDNFDIWRIDLSSEILHPICLTNGYGRKNDIQFRFIRKIWPDGKSIPEFLHFGNQFLLTGFNLSSKNQGFYTIPGDGKGEPQVLSEGPYIYMPDFAEIIPVRAASANDYLVKRSDARDAPNYFITSDFKHFKPLTDFAPEKKYNWFYTELMDFTSLNGNKSKAVIYKPENFNPSHKYPVILHYYEKWSDKLNEYQFLFDKINMDFSIPWFVSHGYIVVSPDIYYTIRDGGEDALSAILGVTRALEAYPWVDAKHIGLQGESFGGFETNYIVTHSNRFAAAISSSGTVDETQEYNFLWGNLGPAKQTYEEESQGRMGATPWEEPAAYIKKSAIFHVDRLKTPMLIVANTKDGNVSFQQGLSFYLSMRRLGKVGWMLQYDHGGHGLGQDPKFIDFTIRSQQFFDYYLKGVPAPRWMVEGIPANRKNIDNGFDLEPKGINPGPGLPTVEEQQKINLLERREPAQLIIPWKKE